MGFLGRTTYSVAFGLLMVLLFSIFIFNRLRITRKQKQIIESQKKIVDQKNKHITDSINYAKRIQDAILPSEEEFKKCFSEHFIFFQPRDIVSGDFYWLSSMNGKVVLAGADCTGHGVPGAFISAMANTFLNEIVHEKKILKPSEILNELRKNIIDTFIQSGETKTKDGLDVALCVISNDMLQFAGAYNSLWIVREKKCMEIKADKFPVGMLFDSTMQPFTNHEIFLQKGDAVYVFSDGYADQFGGPKGKKFRCKNLEEALLTISEKSMHEQKKIIEKTFKNWRGNLDQVDDVLIIGVRI